MKLFGWDPFKKDEGIPCGNSVCDTKTKVYRRFSDGCNYCARCQPQGEEPVMTKDPDQIAHELKDREAQILQLKNEIREIEGGD